MKLRTLPQPKTDAIIEGVRMVGSMLEYRENQLAALEMFSGEQERTIQKLVEALRAEMIATDRMMAQGSRDLLDWKDASRMAGDRMRALLRELGETS